MELKDKAGRDKQSCFNNPGIVMKVFECINHRFIDEKGSVFPSEGFLIAAESKQKAIKKAPFYDSFDEIREIKGKELDSLIKDISSGRVTTNFDVDILNNKNN